jgi:hypothetical protein
MDENESLLYCYYHLPVQWRSEYPNTGRFFDSTPVVDLAVKIANESTPVYDKMVAESIIALLSPEF